MVTERGGKLRPRDICRLQQLTGPQPHRLPSIFHRQMLSPAIASLDSLQESE